MQPARTQTSRCLCAIWSGITVFNVIVVHDLNTVQASNERSGQKVDVQTNLDPCCIMWISLYAYIIRYFLLVAA